MTARRKLIQAGMAMAVLPAARSGRAQTYPSRLIRIIVPWPVGGPSDAMLRPVADKLAAALGQSVVLESRPGANGTIGSALVAKAVPDGHTLLLSHAGPMSVSPTMKGFKAYDPIKDFAPISQMTSSSMVVVVRGELPVRSIRELIDHSKAQAKKLNLGSVGTGSTTHLAAAMLAARSGLQFVHVPYKGSTPLVTDLIAGQVEFSIVGMSAVSAFLPGGRLRALAMTSPQRWPLNPELPTVSETVPGFEVNPWYALHAPAGTPQAITALLSGHIRRILALPEIVAAFHHLSMQPTSSTPEQLEARTRADLALWAPVVAEVGLSAE